MHKHLLEQLVSDIYCSGMHSIVSGFHQHSNFYKTVTSLVNLTELK
jgi:hypothetical protein